MIFREDGAIRLGGATLPGLIKKLEVTGSARIEEAEVEGSAAKPKQAVGYDDVKITIELIVDETEDESAMEKIAQINRLFRRGSAKKPRPLNLVCREADVAGVDRVLFKDLKVNKTNQTNQYSVNIELWEYIPFTITTTKATTGSTSGQAPSLNQNYQDYISNGSRGTAPGKAAASPAKDRQPSQTWVKNHLDRL